MTPYEQTRREIAREADRVLAERFPEYRALSPHVQQLAVALEQDAHAPPHNDSPTITVVDTGERSGIRVERHDRPNGDRAWLDFTAGDALVSVDLIGGRPGLDLLIDGEQITSGWVDDPLWTLDDLRRLHADLGRLLADGRLVGALAEQVPDDDDDGERESDESQYDDPPPVPWREPA